MIALLLVARTHAAPPPELALAEGMLSSGRPGMALSLSLQVDGPRGAMVQARALAGLGRCREALARFAALRGGPGWGTRSLLDEARCFRHLGDEAGERAALDEALWLDPDHLQAWDALARWADRNGDVALGEVAREALLEAGAEGWQLDLIDARRAVMHGMPEADALLMSLVGWRHHTNEVALLEGLRWLQLGWPEQAAAALYEAVRGDLRDPEAAAWRAEALRRCGDFDQAEAALARPWIATQDPTPLLERMR